MPELVSRKEVPYYPGDCVKLILRNVVVRKGLPPLVSCDLDLPWCPIIGASDAAPSGYGVVTAEVGEDLARKLGRLAEKRGDYVVLDGSEWAPLGEALGDDSVPYTKFEASRASRQGTPFPIDLRAEDGPLER